jgi:hypothetical protein
VRFGLASWFRRPCSRAPSHETVFFFALASAFFFSISFVFHRLVVEVCCCYGVACAFSDVEAEFKKQKLRLSRFFACLST